MTSDSLQERSVVAEVEVNECVEDSLGADAVAKVGPLEVAEQRGALPLLGATGDHSSDLLHVLGIGRKCHRRRQERSGHRTVRRRESVQQEGEPTAELVRAQVQPVDDVGEHPLRCRPGQCNERLQHRSDDVDPADLTCSHRCLECCGQSGSVAHVRATQQRRQERDEVGVVVRCSPGPPVQERVAFGHLQPVSADQRVEHGKEERRGVRFASTPELHLRGRANESAGPNPRSPLQGAAQERSFGLTDEPEVVPGKPSNCLGGWRTGGDEHRPDPDPRSAVLPWLRVGCNTERGVRAFPRCRCPQLLRACRLDPRFERVEVGATYEVLDDLIVQLCGSVRHLAAEGLRDLLPHHSTLQAPPSYRSGSWRF